MNINPFSSLNLSLDVIDCDERAYGKEYKASNSKIKYEAPDLREPAEPALGRLLLLPLKILRGSLHHVLLSQIKSVFEAALDLHSPGRLFKFF